MKAALATVYGLWTVAIVAGGMWTGMYALVPLHSVHVVVEDGTVIAFYHHPMTRSEVDRLVREWASRDRQKADELIARDRAKQR
jgi:hypothetical protein